MLTNYDDTDQSLKTKICEEIVGTAKNLPSQIGHGTNLLKPRQDMWILDIALREGMTYPKPA